MNDIQLELNKLKEKIDDSKTKLAQLTGRRAELLRQLKDNFNLNSLDDATIQLNQDKIELTALEKKLITKFNELKEQYDW